MVSGKSFDATDDALPGAGFALLVGLAVSSKKQLNHAGALTALPDTGQCLSTNGGRLATNGQLFLSTSRDATVSASVAVEIT